MNHTALDQQPITAVPYLVLDFETVTHKGYPPEPVEVAALRIQPPGELDAMFQVDWLIQPPPHLPLSVLEAGRLGVRPEDFRQKPLIAAALAQFDALCQGSPAVLVAHNAPYDASFIRRNRAACPHLAGLPFIDTVKLAKHLLPTLRAYNLDTLAHHFALPIPRDRHRALPDVRLTCAVLLRLLALWPTQHKDLRIHLLRVVAGVDTEPAPTQLSLF